ncbi:unnamed protein product, partial [Sphenostylis stenocarpa]
TVEEDGRPNVNHKVHAQESMVTKVDSHFLWTHLRALMIPRLAITVYSCLMSRVVRSLQDLKWVIKCDVPCLMWMDVKGCTWKTAEEGYLSED